MIIIIKNFSLIHFAHHEEHKGNTFLYLLIFLYVSSFSQDCMNDFYVPYFYFHFLLPLCCAPHRHIYLLMIKKKRRRYLLRIRIENIALKKIFHSSILIKIFFNGNLIELLKLDY